ncbi:helicase-related protein [Paenibacillus sp. FSL R5-0912]|uniref:helicase-related protein n=1 Tax=Paenibacillus sp. FSL R5-0912 TaxID=1536771 RepID=UPI00069408B7|nr:helicase-related protein [Paenibacillus sp. FSL R5-0912]
MRVAVYAVECNAAWEIRISLNMAVDRLWWNAEGNGVEGWGGGQADRLVLLSPSLPLGWGVQLREGFKASPAMRLWKKEDWKSYIANCLKAEIRQEQAAGGFREAEWLTEGNISGESMLDRAGGDVKEAAISGNYGGEQVFPKESLLGWGGPAALAVAANQLAAVLAGRSLLQGEVDALVAERLPELAENWPAAAQLAHLQRRIRIGAAVAYNDPKRGGGVMGQRSKVKQSVKETERTDNLKQGGGVLERMSETVAGRGSRPRLTVGRFPQVTGRLLRGAALRLPLLRLPRRGAAARRGAPRCLRCGSVPTGRTACAACGLAGCAYCEACLALGRSRACALLLRSAPLPAVRCTAGVSPTVAARRWGLSAAQAAAAAAALGFLAEPRERSAVQGPERFLLWAVTGAGKTEITFPLLEAALAAGGRALIATPRRDVVLELAPRLAKAFPGDTPAVLYGGSEDRWRASRITLATTHQLLRFNQAFDLVIIDELDAFPYHNDPMLAYAAGQVCKPSGSFIFLSATPPMELQRLARSGRLPHARVPVRFHGHPLPVPVHLHMPPLHRCLKQGRLPGSLIRALQRSLNRKAQIFLFVSRIAHIAGLLQLLRRVFPGVPIEGTSSKDPDRAEKVLEFRNCTISLLVTTTILERGVTVPRSDVFILDADSSLFDEAALVQMAGRAGRSKDDPDGHVVFASAEWSKSQRRAISQIRSMNAIAHRQGYL